MGKFLIHEITGGITVELSAELEQRMQEASRDASWAEKVRATATWEEYAKLLAAKDIEAT